jgi:hypothetical protein
MPMIFPSDAQRGIPAWLTKFTSVLIRARYRNPVGDSNAAGKVPLIIQGAPSQTANLVEYYDGSKNGLAALDAAGNYSAVAFFGSGPDTAFNNAGGNTITAAQLLWGQIRRTGGGAQTDTTPTAAQIVAAITNCRVGTEFEVTIYNNSGGVHTLGLGTGVTGAAGITNTLTTAAGNAHFFLFRITNATVGSEAVTIYSQGASAS